MKRETRRILDRDPGDMRGSYHGECGIFAQKLSGLHAISRLYGDDNLISFAERMGIVIEPEDAEWAIRKVYRHIQAFSSVYMKWKSQTVDQQVESDISNLEKIASVISETEFGIANWTQIRKGCRWSGSKKHVEFRDAAVSQGMIFPLDNNKINGEYRKQYLKSNRTQLFVVDEEMYRKWIDYETIEFMGVINE
jgi:hypothetical protein